MNCVFDEVLAGLRAVLASAERRKDASFFKVQSANRFLWQLPGAWRGKWWNLHIKSDVDGEASRENFIADLRATIAFLETHRACRTAAGTPGPQGEAPIDAAFAEVKPERRGQLKVVEKSEHNSGRRP